MKAQLLTGTMIAALAAVSFAHAKTELVNREATAAVAGDQEGSGDGLIYQQNKAKRKEKPNEWPK